MNNFFIKKIKTIESSVGNNINGINNFTLKNDGSIDRSIEPSKEDTNKSIVDIKIDINNLINKYNLTHNNYVIPFTKN